MGIKELRYRQYLWSAVSIICMLMACVFIYLFCYFAEIGGIVGMVCMVVAGCASFYAAYIADTVSCVYEEKEREYLKDACTDWSERDGTYR